MAGMSPMMVHYLETKKQYPDCILFYRLGDFYEMFFEDALTVSKELEITLTGKECGLEERAPMCGVPYHALDNYLYRLVQKGYKVAIAEQMEDPKQAKGLVKREVIRVVTPGTITSAQALDETKNNYLMGIVYIDERFGIAVSDISTGDFLVTEVASERELADEINKFCPSEIICNDAFFVSGVDTEEVKNRYQTVISALDSHFFSDEGCRKILKEHFKVGSLDGLGLQDYDTGVIAAGAVMEYMYETQKSTLSHITTITPYSTGEFMIIDTSTRRNLELLETMREKQKRGTLLWVLDKTKTAMGARLLRTYIEQPLIHKDDIIARQNAIEELNMNYISREEICEYLNPIYDLERLMGRVVYGSANARDLKALGEGLGVLPELREQVKNLPGRQLAALTAGLDDLPELRETIAAAICDEPPFTIREAGFIRDGYDEEVDRLRGILHGGKGFIADIEAREKEKTGIKSLKVGYNKVFGYYIEVSKSYYDQVPETYIRKQTLANCERYITQELKDLEHTVLTANDRLAALEYQIFCDLREKVSAQVRRVQSAAAAVAELDVLTSFAQVAEKNNYCRPDLDESDVIEIHDGRHPVVEQMLKDSLFVPNDTFMGAKEDRVAIITGPNMAGKSTYMRQVALIVLMAQVGSFVPAKSAHIGVVDRIFTRIGASDDLSAGQSTFMVEMTEVADILRQATRRSLLILDEIGRGTSTFDGMSIARAVLEYCADRKMLGAKTLFATHYHELTELEGSLPGVVNYNIAVKTRGEDIVFLRKILPGGADRSYGIEVAKLAGLPDRVLARAREILTELEAENGVQYVPARQDKEQVSLDAMAEGEVLDALRRCQPDTLTPIEAMGLLYELKQKLR